MTDAPVATKSPYPFVGVQRIIYDRLRAMEGADVPIAVLYCAAFDVAYRDKPSSNKVMQMALGGHISSINKRLAATCDERVVTGTARRTYKLDRA